MSKAYYFVHIWTIRQHNIRKMGWATWHSLLSQRHTRYAVSISSSEMYYHAVRSCLMHPSFRAKTWRKRSDRVRADVKCMYIYRRILRYPSYSCIQISLKCSFCVQSSLPLYSSRKHTYIIFTPSNPTII